MALTADQERKRVSKLWNEHLKLIASGFNTMAAGSAVGVVIVPALTKPGETAPVHVEWLFAAFVLHCIGQIFLAAFYLSEE